jgi:hypothetical protein
LKQPPKVGLDAMMMSKMYLKTVKKSSLKKNKEEFSKKNTLIKENSSLIKVEFLN